jgi:membrane-associated phospholipid phosphatase
VPLAILLAGLIACLALYPFDSAVYSALANLKLPGDIRREWSALQQFGQGTSIALLALTIYLLDKPRRARLFDFALALAVVLIAVNAMKLFIGRPRPILGDASTFLLPWGTFPIKLPDGSTINAHAWDLTAPTHAQLWSMPSAHTAAAVVTALFIAALYPPIRWIAAFLALTVAAGRLVFEAHWLTDVVAGAAIGAAIAWPVVTGQMGVALARKLQRAK